MKKLILLCLAGSIAVGFSSAHADLKEVEFVNNAGPGVSVFFVSHKKPSERLSVSLPNRSGSNILDLDELAAKEIDEDEIMSPSGHHALAKDYIAVRLGRILGSSLSGANVPCEKGAQTFTDMDMNLIFCEIPEHTTVITVNPPDEKAGKVPPLSFTVSAKL